MFIYIYIHMYIKIYISKCICLPVCAMRKYCLKFDADNHRSKCDCLYTNRIKIVEIL